MGASHADGRRLDAWRGLNSFLHKPLTCQMVPFFRQCATFLSFCLPIQMLFEVFIEMNAFFEDEGCPTLKAMKTS